MWEYGPAVRQENGRRLVITPESQRHLRPMLRTILERAPKIAGWEFYPYRLAETLGAGHLGREVAVGRRRRVGADRCERRAGRKIDLAFSFPKHKTLDEEKAMHAAFVATETLLGEQVLDTWIGTIGLAEGAEKRGTRPAAAGAGARHRGCVDPQLDRSASSTRAQDISASQNWATIKLDPPEEADDYPARSDLLIAATQQRRAVSSDP